MAAVATAPSMAGPSVPRPTSAASSKPPSKASKKESDTTLVVPAKVEEGSEVKKESSPDKENPSRPPIRPIPAARSKFDLEPNPFEQSFSARSHRSQSEADDSAHVQEGEKGKTPPRGGDATATRPNALPPLSSLTSPAAADPTQFPWLANQSLRAGPLSPAMLAGPQNGKNGHAAGNGNGAGGEGEGGFDASTFRTGFTPGTGSGFTPSYSSLMGGSSFSNLPLPSPNTAAFLNMVTNATPIEADTSGENSNGNNGNNNTNNTASNAQGPSAIPPHMQQHGLSHINNAEGGDTITPNTLNALTGVFNDMNRQASQPGQNGQSNQPSQNNSHPPIHHAHSQPLPHGQPMHPQHPHMQPHASYYPHPGHPGHPGQPQMQGPMPGMPPVDYAQQSANAASQAANGLFLLSQAHQELSKREEDSRGPVQGQHVMQGQGHMAPHLTHAHSQHMQQMQMQQHPGMQDKRTSGSQPPQPQPKGAQAQAAAGGAGSKRKSDAGPGGKSKKGKKGDRNGSVGPVPGISMPGLKGDSESPMAGDDSDMEEMDDDNDPNKKPETEEEKRKNFLERNRQAALKCRQRKKAWLNELQTKVEQLQMENDRLNQTVAGLHDEVSRLTGILMQHRDCGLAGPPPGMPGQGQPGPMGQGMMYGRMGR